MGIFSWIPWPGKQTSVSELAQSALEIESGEMSRCATALGRFNVIESCVGFGNPSIGNHGKGHLCIHRDSKDRFLAEINAVLTSLLDIKSSARQFASLSRRLEAAIVLFRDGSLSGKRKEMLGEDELHLLTFARALPNRINQVSAPVRWLIANADRYSYLTGYGEPVDKGRAKIACEKLVDAKQRIGQLLEELRRFNALERDVRANVMSWAGQKAA